MEFRCIAQGLAEALDAWDGDTLAVGLFATDPEGATHPLRQEPSRRFGEVLAQQLDQRGFKGKPSDCVSFARLEPIPSRKASHTNCAQAHRPTPPPCTAAASLSAPRAPVPIPSASGKPWARDHPRDPFGSIAAPRPR